MEASENDFSREIIGAAVEVQRVLGSGLLEGAYCAALALELGDRGLRIQREVSIPAEYKGRSLGVGYRADLLVEDSVIIEVKTLEFVTDIHRAQLLSYLRLGKYRLGLLINFRDFPVASKGVSRIVNRL